MTVKTEIPQVNQLQLMWRMMNRHDETQIEIFADMAREYGPIFQVHTPKGVMNVISSDELAEEVCDDQYYEKRNGPGVEQARAVAGDGLFTAHNDEPNWRKAHTLLMPAFSDFNITAYLPQMQDIAMQLVAKWDGLGPDSDVEVPPDMTRLTLDTIGLCGFDYRFDSFKNAQLHPFVQAMNNSLASAQAKLTRNPLVERVMPHKDDGVRKDRELMFKIVDDIIAERKASGERRNDLLDVMLHGVDKKSGESLSDENIRFQMITFLVAGHETTSGLLSFAIYNLMHRPEAMAKGYEEVDRVLGGDLSVAPTAEQIPHLRYVQQILKETLRLYPTAPMFGRTPKTERLLGGKYPVKPGDGISVLTAMLHRDPKVWGDDAEQFRPERFDPELEAKLPPNAYKPFGTGVRACIGRPFAMQEATLVLAMLLQRYSFVDHYNYQLHLRQSLTIKPLDFKIRIRRRAPVAHVAKAPADTADTAPASFPGAGRCPIAHETAAPAEPPAATGHNTPLLLLYGSNMGTSERIARGLAESARRRGFAPTVGELDSYVDKLPKEGAVIIVTASYNGTPPDDAIEFCKWLDGPVDADCLKGVKYAVFGCGNHEWASTFQAIPRKVDAGLEARGAERIIPHGEGDAADDFDASFQAWTGTLWGGVAKRLGLAIEEPTTPRGPKYEVEVLEEGHPNPLASNFQAKPMVVIDNHELHRKSGDNPSPRSARHIEVTLPEGVTYRTGDHLGVVGRNPEVSVQQAAARFGLDIHARVRVHRKGTEESVLPVDQIVSIGHLLGDYVELHAVALRKDIKTLAEHTESPAEQARLNALWGDDDVSKAKYREYILDPNRSLIDLLEETPSCRLPFALYLEMLPVLKPRYYSISSSPLLYERIASVTVGRVEAPARCGHGTYRGVCSTFLSVQPKGTAIYAFVQDTKSTFRPPVSALTPIIMVGPGTGLAPFRGFLQERAALKARGAALGPALLFFGCRHPQQDYIYQDELEGFASEGVVDLDVAFSRLEGQPKTYVQDRILARKDEVWQMLEDGAVVFICGEGAHMAPAVRKSLEKICSEKTGKSEAEATQWMDELARSNRYLSDVWAAGG